MESVYRAYQEEPPSSHWKPNLPSAPQSAHNVGSSHGTRPRMACRGLSIMAAIQQNELWHSARCNQLTHTLM